MASSGPAVHDGLDAEFAGFVRREEERLLPAAFLVRADLRRAEQLVEDALVEVGRRWPQAVDEEPALTVRHHLYRAAVAEATRDGSGEQASAALAGDSGESGWGDRDRTTDEQGRRRRVGRALGGLTPRQRAVLCLLALDAQTVTEAARTLRVLPRTVRGDARDALAALARDLPGESLDGRADGPAVHWLLEAAVADLPAPDLAESAALRARAAGRSVRRRSLLVAGGVVGAGALTAIVVDRLGQAPALRSEPASAVLGTATVDGVTVYLAPAAADEDRLPFVPDRGALDVPDPVGPGEPERLVPIFASALAGPVQAVYLVRFGPRSFTPVVQGRSADGTVALRSVPTAPVETEDTNVSACGPSSIDSARRRVVLPSRGKVLFVDVTDGMVVEVTVPDPRLRTAGWTADQEQVVAEGRDSTWLVDPGSGEASRADGPVYGGWGELFWAGGDATELRRYGDRGLLGQVDVPGPNVVPFGLTASTPGGWSAATAFLPEPYQKLTGRSQGVLAVHAAGAGPPRVLAAEFPAGSTAVRYRVLRWADEGRLLVESLGDGPGADGRQRRVLLWDVRAGTLHLVTDVVGVGDVGSWFSGLWGL